MFQPSVCPSTGAKRNITGKMSAHSTVILAPARCAKVGRQTSMQECRDAPAQLVLCEAQILSPADFPAQEVEAPTPVMAAYAAPIPPSALPLVPKLPGSPVVQLTPETFESYLKEAGDDLVLIDFYTDWCGPCKLMHAELEKLTRAFTRGVRFAKFNCGEPGHETFSTKQRIRSLPTFRLYKRSMCLEQVTGARPVHLRQTLSHFYRP